MRARQIPVYSESAFPRRPSKQTAPTKTLSGQHAQHGTATGHSIPNTTGLGEYTNRELLAELAERGVMERIIGLNEEIATKIDVKKYIKSPEYSERIDRIENVYAERNMLRDGQRKRLEKMLA